ncbi:MAG TPA: type II toxin-antitoxin system VapC family toxin [Marmoricola sp.]
MNLLLDTHVLLWFATDSRRLTKRSRTLLSAATERYVSASSAYEIATKTRLGKLPGGNSLLDAWPVLIRNLQASELPLSAAHMARAGRLDWGHRDPFDRMLVAQAQVEGLVLLTNDEAIRRFEDVRTRWT